MLTSWNVKRIPVRGDGNCLFAAVEFAIVQRMQTGDTVLPDTLLSLGLPVDQKHDVYQVSMLLRRAMVSEWLENTDVYQAYELQHMNSHQHNSSLGIWVI